MDATAVILKHGGENRAPPCLQGLFRTPLTLGDGQSHLCTRCNAAPAGLGGGGQLGLNPGPSGYEWVMKRLSSSGYDYGQAPHSLTFTFFIYTRISNPEVLCRIREILRINE